MPRSIIRGIRAAQLAALLLALPVLSEAQAPGVVTLRVRLGAEAAEYAFVRRNAQYIGQCDGEGVLTLTAETLAPGDTLQAEFAGIRSKLVLVGEGVSVYELNISVRQLTSARVVGDDVRLMKEYLDRINRFRITDLEFVHKYRLGYEVASARDVPLRLIRDEGKVDMCLIHGHDVGDDDDFWYTFGPEKDSLVMEGCATSLLYAQALLYYIHDAATLRKDAKRGAIRMHRMVTEEGDLCYLFLEGKNWNNQTVVRFNGKGTILKEIVRSFAGSGTVITATPGTVHDFSILMKGGRYRASVAGTRFAVRIPEAGNLRTLVILHSVKSRYLTDKEDQAVKTLAMNYSLHHGGIRATRKADEAISR